MRRELGRRAFDRRVAADRELLDPLRQLLLPTRREEQADHAPPDRRQALHDARREDQEHEADDEHAGACSRTVPSR